MTTTLRCIFRTYCLDVTHPLKMAVGNRFMYSSLSKLKMMNTTKTAHVYYPFPLFFTKTIHLPSCFPTQVSLLRNNLMEYHETSKAILSQVKVHSSSVTMKVSPRISLKKISHKTIEASSKVILQYFY
jgi:hypothetical protein